MAIIERADAARPVVPAFLTLSSLSRYLEHVPLPISLGGHETIVAEVNASFLAFVRTGSALVMSYKVCSPERDTLGPKMPCEFRIRIEGRIRDAVQGKMLLRFIEKRLYEMLIRRA